MKVIDLLNKIANGEEVPEKIKYDSKTYHYGYYYQWYLTDNLCEELFIDKNHLNDEIEIIEDTPKEEKKIPEKLTDILRVDDLIPPVDENMYKIWTQTIKNQNKINEIIDRLNGKE
jgi:hypothetical protein